MRPDLAPNGPLILVGQPRSGSTLLTRIINESQDFYVLNDLYILQEVDACNGWASLDDRGAERMLGRLREVIRRRSSPEKAGKSLANSSPMPEGGYETTKEFLYSDELPTRSWVSVIRSSIGFAAAQAGATTWGWNTPQDYLHLGKLFNAFPEARVIFLLRDPRNMLKSYKFHPKEDYAERYHPAAQAFSWRSAARGYEAAKKRWPDRILLVRYEDIVGDQANQIARINEFLGSAIPVKPLESLGSNSSFKSDAEKPRPRELNPTEIWVADKLLLRERRLIGYDYQSESPRLRDLPSLLRSTLVFSMHYFRKILLNPDTRTRVLRLLQANMKKKSPAGPSRS